MNETDIRNVVGPLLSTGEEIIWISPTDPEAKIAVFDELRQHAKDRATDFLFGAVFVALLMVFVPFMRAHPQEWIGGVVAIIGLDVIAHLTKVWMTKRDKIGGYALTRSHLYEFDVTGKMRRKLDIAPMGKSINSFRVMRWLPDTVTAKQVQAAIG